MLIASLHHSGTVRDRIQKAVALRLAAEGATVITVEIN
jgi:hypothetical protein